MKKWTKTLALALSAALMGTSLTGFLPVGTVQAAEKADDGIQLYVAKNGDDSNDGTREHPLETLEGARNAVRKLNGNMSCDIYVNIAAGEYFLKDTLTFSEEDSGTNGHRIIYRSMDGPSQAKVIGGYRLDPEWEMVERSGADADLPAAADGKVYKTHVGTEYLFNTLYVNDERATLARTKNREKDERFPSAKGEYMHTAGGGIHDFIYRSDELDEESIRGLVNAQSRGDLDAQIFVFNGGSWDWMTDTLPVESIDAGSNRVYLKQDPDDPAMYRPKYYIGGGSRYFLQGNLGFLDVPGEYYFNKTTGYLYYYPEGDIAQQDIVIPTMKRVVELQGTSVDSKVQNITFDGLQFKDSDTTDWYAYGWNWGDAGAGLGYYPKEAEGSYLPSYCEQTERIEFHHGVLFLSNTENITITNSNIRNAGMWGIDLYLGNRYTDINNCLIENTGHGGVNLEGGYPGTGGSVGDDGIGVSYNRDNEVTNCLIHDIGEQVGQTAGIAVNNSSYNTFSRLEIYNSPRRLVMYTAGMQRNPNVGYPDGDRDVDRLKHIYAHHNTTEYAYLHDGQQDGGDDGAFFSCYLYYGQEVYQPNYLNQILVDRIGANPSMHDLPCCGLSTDMGGSGMEIRNFKSVNTQHMNGQLSSSQPDGYNSRMIIENTNIQYPYGAIIEGDKELDDSRMEYDKIGVDWSVFPSEYRVERSDYQTPDFGPDKSEIYFEDEFESGEMDFKKWDYLGNKPEITDLWMSEYVFEGKGSLFLNGGSVYRSFGQELNKKVSVKFFDRQNYHLGPFVESWFKIVPKSFAGVGTEDYMIEVGIDQAAENEFYLMKNGSELITTEIPRTYGWHKVEWDYSHGENVEVWLDGNLLMTTDRLTAFDRIQLGSDEQNGVSWYDQLYVYGGKEAPPVEDLPQTHSIPGKVEAEAYLAMSGIRVEDCGDEGSGSLVADIQAGDWVEYSVNPETGGMYHMNSRIAVDSGKTAEFDVYVNDKLVQTVKLNSTEGQWQTCAADISLKTGRQQIKLAAKSDGWKLNWVDFAYAGPEAPGRIEAEKYTDINGPKIDGIGLGYIGDGGWMEYKLFVKEPGRYKINYRMAANSDAGKVEFTANGESLSTVNLPITGGWQNWNVVDGGVADFAQAGEYTIRLNVIKGGWNLDWIELSDKDVPVTPIPPVLEEIILEENFDGATVTEFKGNKPVIKWEVMPETLESTYDESGNDISISGNDLSSVSGNDLSDISGNDISGFKLKNSVSGGDLSLAANNILHVTHPDGTLFIPGGEEWSNYIFQCRIKIAGWDPEHQLPYDIMSPAWYIRVPADNPNTLERYSLKYTRSGEEFKLHKRASGWDTDMLMSAAPTDYMNVWHDYKIVMDQGMITAYIDDEKIFEHEDVSLKGGTVGFDGINTEYYIDDISVKRQKTANPAADIPSGGFKDSLRVKLSAAQPGTTIVYTLDGSDPVTNGIVYESHSGIEITQTTTLKFAAAQNGKMYSDVITCEYIKMAVSVDKTTLRKTYEEALTLNTDGVVESAEKFFDQAMAEAKATLENENVTQEEVNAAWNKLIDAIHGLGLTQGNKESLRRLVERAEAMKKNKDKYVETNWQQFLDALLDARQVLNNGDAMEEDIKPAEEKLLQAILAQRYKANKENLRELLDRASQIDQSLYTEESVVLLRTAYAKAASVWTDDTLSEDDQQAVDSACEELNNAMLQLVKKEDQDPTDPSVPEDPEPGNPSGERDNVSEGGVDQGQKEEDPGQKAQVKAPKTGDNAPIGALTFIAVCGAACVTGTVCAEKKKKG